MTSNDVRAVLKIYKDRIEADGILPIRVAGKTNMLFAAGLLEEDDPWPQLELQHALWMCDEVDHLMVIGDWGKAMRWLGFIQGVLWMSGIFAIDDLRADLVPRMV